MSRINPALLQARKNPDQPIVCLTAYTAPMAAILDPYCDLLLVGDSLGMALYGMDNTLGVTLDMIINHTKAVMRASERACIVADMPYGTYEDNADQALTTAQTLMRETGCQAVKLEGGVEFEETISHLTRNNIPVMGHIGLQPQSVEKEGGYKVKGKTDEQKEKLFEDAKAVERAGAFSVVLEGTIEPVAQEVTKAVSIPVIGIGASVACDGQILVTEDMIGLLQSRPPKFAKQYGDLKTVIGEMVQTYHREVQAREFPTADYTYHAPHAPGQKSDHKSKTAA